MFPNRVFIAAFLFKLTQFIERIGEIVFLQIIDDPPCGDAVEITQRLRRLSLAVGNDVFMIRHYRISKDAEFPRLTGFVESLAGNLFEFVSLENWQPVVCYRCEEIARRVYRNSHHLENIGGVAS